MRVCRHIAVGVVLAAFAATAHAETTGPAAPPPMPDAGSSAVAAAVDPFPVPSGLAEGVAFWKRVWSEWTLGQAVLHDDVHHSIVYEVVELPGPITDDYTEAQRAFVKERKEALAERLEVLEKKVSAGEPLDDDEKALALKITEAAGAEAISGAHDRVRGQRGLRERFLSGVAVSGRYLPEFKAIFRAQGLPEDLAYLPHVESSFRPDARSSVGALGMWQFMRSTGRKFLTITSSVDERLDPVAAARGAAKYMRSAYDQLGSWPLTVTSYNHGVDGMRRAKDQFGTDFESIVADYAGTYFKFASRNFYMSFVAARDLAKEFEATPPEGLSIHAPIALDRVVLAKAATAVAIARRYAVPLGELADLNRAWTKRAVRGGVPIPAGVAVWLPEGTLGRLASNLDGRPQARAASHPGDVSPRARRHR